MVVVVVGDVRGDIGVGGGGVGGGVDVVMLTR